MRLRKSAAAAAIGFALLIHAGAAHAATVYKASDEDTFWSLSNKFDVPLNELMAANPKVNPYNIYQGLPIVIPNAEQKLVKAEAAGPAAETAATMSVKSISDDAAENTITVDGREYGYSDVVQARASAYTAAASENGIWGAVDYFGNPLKLGTIAVDPNRIPMGSKVYVTGYDYDGLPKGGMIAVAADQGGAIKGDRIDIFVPDSQWEARQFGFQYVKVFVLE